MWKSLRILLLLWMLAFASVGNAHAARQDRDALRWNNIADQHAPQAWLSDGQTTCRVIPVRPERLRTASETEPAPTHGRTVGALFLPQFLSIGSIAAPCLMASRMLLTARRTLSFIALRHIVR